jgi:hypothetical protein
MTNSQQFWSAIEDAKEITDSKDVFWQQMDRKSGSITAELNRGDNGSLQWSNHGMGGGDDASTPLQGYLVAAFNGLKRLTSRQDVIQYLVNIETEAKKFGDTCYYNTMAATFVMAFQVRDPRGVGKGEKDVSRWLLLELYTRFPQTFLDLLPLFPEYGYWKDFNFMIQDLHNYYGSQHKLLPLLYDFLVQQYREDLNTFQHRKDGEKPKLSLLIKFIPKEGRSFDKKYGSTKQIVKRLYPQLWKGDAKSKRLALKKFRQNTSQINKAIQTTETMMHQGLFSLIQFRLVPGRCRMKNQRAFFNLAGGSKCRLTDARFPNDPDRIKCRENILQFIQDAKTGKTKINSQTISLHELLRKLWEPSNHYSIPGQSLSQEEIDLVQLQWESKRDDLIKLCQQEGVECNRGLVCCDTSGSMSTNNGIPRLVALAISIMTSSLQDGVFCK